MRSNSWWLNFDPHPFGHGSKAKARTRSEHPKPTTKIGSQRGGEFTYPKMGSRGQGAVLPEVTRDLSRLSVSPAAVGVRHIGPQCSKWARFKAN